MKVGARNRIVGKVKDIKKGGVMCLVKLTIPAQSSMASVMTIESLKELGIKIPARMPDGTFALPDETA